MRHILLSLIITLTLLAAIHQTSAQGTTAFTYQGQLHDNGTNANGTYTMVFALYDSLSGGNQIGSTITSSPTLANGLFTVSLDFGTGAFNGNARYLDITVQNGSDSQELSPRVQVLPTPYAQFAAIAATVTNGAIMNAQMAVNSVETTNILSGAVTTAQIANGAVTNQNLAINAVATINIQNGAITDAKITSVSGGKITGTVANAINAVAAVGALEAVSALILTNDLWSVETGDYANYSDALLFSDDNDVIAALVPDADGKGNVEFVVDGAINLTDQIKTGGSLTFANDDSSIFFGSGGYIKDDGSGGISINNITFGADEAIDSDLQVNGDLTVGGSITASDDVTALAFNSTSDRNAKDKFEPVDCREVLSEVLGLPITSWNFKKDKYTRHIGPMAQDFYAAFKVGSDDKHIATVDEGGVALAAIQGLNENLKEKDAQIDALNKRLTDLERLVRTSTQK